MERNGYKHEQFRGKFNELHLKYVNIIGTVKKFDVWNDVFNILLGIIDAERKLNPDYAKELSYLTI